MEEELEEWPPAEARLRSALWRAEVHFEQGEYVPASRALSQVLPIAGDMEELVRGLHHLAAAGYRAQTGELERARRQLAHARRRLAPYLPAREEVDLAALLDLVASDIES